MEFGVSYPASFAAVDQAVLAEEALAGEHWEWATRGLAKACGL